MASVTNGVALNETDLLSFNGETTGDDKFTIFRLDVENQEWSQIGVRQAISGGPNAVLLIGMSGNEVVFNDAILDVIRWYRFHTYNSLPKALELVL